MFSPVLEWNTYNKTRRWCGMAVNCTVTRIKGCPIEYRVGYNVIYLFLCVLGIVTNILNLIVLSSRRFRINSSSFTYMRGLAVFDWLTCVLSIPYGIAKCNIMTRTGVLLFRFYICFIYFPIVSATGACSVFITLAMSIDRLVQLKLPFLKMGTKSSRNAAITTALLYFSSQIIHMPFFFGYTLDRTGLAIPTPWRMSKQFDVFMWISTILVRIVPIIGIFIVNVSLAIVLHQVWRKRQKVHQQPVEKSKTTTGVHGSGNRDQHDQGGHLRVTLTLMAVALIYLVCMIPEPFSHAVIFEAIGGPCSDETRGFRVFRVVVKLLELITYSTNFFPYVICNTMFRQVLVDNVCRCKPVNNVGLQSFNSQATTVKVKPVSSS